MNLVRRLFRYRKLRL